MSDFDKLLTGFKTPPREFSPAPIWWWSGEKLEIGRLRWQMDRFAEGGVYNLVLLNLAPTGPLAGSDQDDPPFLSEGWWQLFELVCQHAKKLGIRIWFYDQIGFSGANFQGQVVAAEPAYAGESLECVTIEGQGALELRCPDGGRPLGAAVWDPDGGPSKKVPLKDGWAKDNSTGQRRLRLFYATRRGFDYFSKKACAALIDRVHGEFDRRAKQWFGSVIAGSFQDELPDVPKWGPTFEADFKRLRGYDILDKLASVFEGESPEDYQVRMDYHATRADLQEASFFKPLFDWHASRGLTCGCDQQGDARSGNPSDAIKTYADYMRTHRWFNAPGSDQHGETKIHSSLAHLYGRDRTWIEAFHSSGWGGTLEETFDWLLPWLRAGATLYDPHAVYYSTKGGWWEWAPPSTCWRQPYWKHYGAFATAVARLCHSLSLGTHRADVAVLFPTSAAQAGTTALGPGRLADQARDTYKALVGHMFFNQPVPGELDKDRRDFDILDDDSLQRGEFSGGSLRVAGEAYSIIILPSCFVLEEASFKALGRFVDAGGLLVALGETPHWVASGGALRPAKEFEAWLAAGKARHAVDPEALGALLKDRVRPVEAPVTTLRRTVGKAEVVLVPAIYPRATQRLESAGWDPFEYSFDPKAYPESMTVLVRGVKGAPELWDPFSGERRLLAAKERENGVEVELPFDCGPAALLVWAEKPQALKAKAAKKAAKALLRLEGPFESKLLPSLDNRFGDIDLPAHKGAPPMQTWFFGHRVEKDAENGLALGWQQGHGKGAAWSEVKATFGVFGWQSAVRDPIWTRPALEASLPADPLDPRSMIPAVYSQSRGIDMDTIHKGMLGVKGHVPEEFLHFGKAKKGQRALFRTSFSVAKAGRCHVALGSRAAKTLWIDGQRFDELSTGYLLMPELSLSKGSHQIEFRLEAREDSEMRAYWALVTDAAAFQRPEWMEVKDGSKQDSVVVFSTTVKLGFEPQGGTIQIGADAALCRILVNGHEIGRQGGFDPYGGNFRVMPYEARHFKAGENQLQIEILDSGRATPSVLVDALITGQGKECAVFSGTHWKTSRDQGPTAAAGLQGGYWYDPAWCHLRRRPHPLPGAAWIEGKALPAVAASSPDAFPGQTRVEWLTWTLPPGAAALTLGIRDKHRLFVDGKEVPVSKGRAKLPNLKAALRQAALRVEASQGRNAGALLEGPVSYECGAGSIHLGDWYEQGLRSYSGGLQYACSFIAPKSKRPLQLDLGRVRGTVEVRVNGKSAGVRVLSPWRFDLGPLLKPGKNRLEIVVYNTLAPWLRAVSPTHYVFPGQEVSGLFGPVSLQES
jgi:hypothetical protein